MTCVAPTWIRLTSVGEGWGFHGDDDSRTGFLCRDVGYQRFRGHCCLHFQGDKLPCLGNKHVIRRWSTVELISLGYTVWISPTTLKLNKSKTDVFTAVKIRGYIQKFSDWIVNEINNINRFSLRSNTKGYGGKTH